MSPNRTCIIAVGAVLLVLASSVRAVADPCCIVLVPPVSPPPSTTPPSGQVYASLPLFAGLERSTFGSLRVEIRRQPFAQSVTTVASEQGAVGLAALTTLAAHIAKSQAKLEIAAVMIDRPYYALYTEATNIGDLKGKTIAIPGIGSLAHLFVIEALRTAGLSPKDVKFIALRPAQVLAAMEGVGVDAAPLPIGYEFAPIKVKLKPLNLPKAFTLPSWVLYASLATLDKEAKELAQLIKGLTEGLSIIRRDTDLTRNILAKQFEITDRVAQDLIIQKYIPLVVSDSVRPDPKEIDRMVDLLRLTGQVKEVTLFNPSRLQKLYPR